MVYLLSQGSFYDVNNTFDRGNVRVDYANGQNADSGLLSR